MGGDHGEGHGHGHGHGNDHGHGRPYEIPDWRKYRVEDAPQLVQVQKMLAQKGLKDPWLRNEVWRYDKAFGTSEWARMRLFVFRGFKWGFAGFVGTVIYHKLFKSSDDHHDHHAHH